MVQARAANQSAVLFTAWCHKTWLNVQSPTLKRSAATSVYWKVLNPEPDFQAAPVCEMQISPCDFFTVTYKLVLLSCMKIIETCLVFNQMYCIIARLVASEGLWFKSQT